VLRRWQLTVANVRHEPDEPTPPSLVAACSLLLPASLRPQPHRRGPHASAVEGVARVGCVQRCAACREVLCHAHTHTKHPPPGPCLSHSFHHRRSAG
jgi:hypothetical protein